MRLSVRVRAQNALFRRVCFSSPAQTWSHLTQRRSLHPPSHAKAHSAPGDSRKSALCTRRLTERRTLGSHSHGKAHFACGSHQKAHSVSEQSRRVRLSVRVRAQNALFRRMCFSLPAQTSGGLTENRSLDRHLTEKRTLGSHSHGKPQSAPAASRKSALCTRRLTENRILRRRRHLDVMENRILHSKATDDLHA